MLYDRKNKKKICLFTAAVVLLSSLLMQGCGQKSENKSYISETPPVSPQEHEDAFHSETGSESIKSPEAVNNDPENNSPESANNDLESNSDLENPKAISPLHVDGSQLMDRSGSPIQLKGISTHGLAWFPEYVNPECFRQLKEEWNVNIIRLAMYTSEYGGYCSGGDQKELKELIKNGVEYAAALNMYVIIDWHILSDGNPNTYKEEAKAFFAEMAELYADHNNVLYEICNEPNGGTSWHDVKSYAEEVIPVIRTYDKNGIIIVGTPNWSQYVDQAAADPITGYDNIMYSLHFYAATHTDSLRNTMKEAIEAGLPVFVTEYGICDASGNGAIDKKQADQWITLMNKYNVSYTAWNLSNKNESSAILLSGCSKTSGFTEDDLSASGKWLYQILTEDNLPDASTTENAKNSTFYSNAAFSFTASLVNSRHSDSGIFYQLTFPPFHTDHFHLHPSQRSPENPPLPVF